MPILFFLIKLSLCGALVGGQVFRSPLGVSMEGIAAFRWASQETRGWKMLGLVLLSSLGSLCPFVHFICPANRFWCDGREGLNSLWWRESLSSSSPNSKTTSWIPPSNNPCLHFTLTVCQLLGVRDEGRLFNLLIPYTVWMTPVNFISEPLMK